jgi:hypothetical protein
VAAQQVSPVESWKGLSYNVFFCAFVLAMMLAFKGTLEALILFENLKRNRGTKKEATTTIVVHKDSAVVQHVDNGSTNTAWQTFAGYALSASCGIPVQARDERGHPGCFHKERGGCFHDE